LVQGILAWVLLLVLVKRVLVVLSVLLLLLLLLVPQEVSLMLREKPVLPWGLA
jgi:hypothetical protein